MLYDHTLRTNPRYLAARATCDRSGGAFENGAPFLSTRRNTLGWGLVLLAAGIGVAATVLGVL